MNVARKRSTLDVLRGFFLLGHPGPTMIFVVAVGVFATIAAWPRIPWVTFALVIAAHLAMQLSIGVTNDYCDRYRDVSSKKVKPIPRGLVLPREALIAAWLLMVIMALLLIPLGPLPLVVSLLYLACMQGYNLGLKGTPASGLVFAVAIPLIPVYAFSGVGHLNPWLWWQIPLAAMLGIAINLANSVPDVPEDTQTQARTLAVALGVKKSLVACFLLLFVIALAIGALALTGLLPTQPWLLPVLVIVTLASVTLLAVFFSKESHRELKVYFYLFTLLGVLLAILWIASVVV